MGGGGLFSVGCVYSEFHLRFLGEKMERRSIAQVTQVSAMEICIFQSFWPVGSTGSPLGRWDCPGRDVDGDKGSQCGP